jgi:hypothetical protein
MIPRSRTKLVAITPELLPVQYGKAVAFVFSSFHFLTFLKSSIGRTGWPILTLKGSNNAVWRKDCLSGVAKTSNFIYGSLFLTESPKNSYGFGWESKNA